MTEFIKQIPNAGKRKSLFEIGVLGQSHIVSVDVCVYPRKWQDVDSNIVLPFSIDSKIYEGVKGDLKIKAFLNTVKSYAKTKILILLCEGAHLNALSLKYQSIDNALNICKINADNLLERYKHDFSDHEVKFWQDFIWKDEQYNEYKAEILNLYKTDAFFRDMIKNDAQRLQIEESLLKSADIAKFYQNSELDLLEMLAGLKVMYKQNYKILIYPGNVPKSFERFQSLLKMDSLIYVNANIKCAMPAGAAVD